MSRPYSKNRNSGNRSGGGGGGGFSQNANRAPFNNAGNRGGGNQSQGGRDNRFNNQNNNSRRQQQGGRQAGGGHGSNFNRSNNNNNANHGGGGGGGSNPSADVMKTLLSLLFEKSYQHVFSEENGLLVLNCMRASPDLSSAQKSVDFNSVTFCKALAEVLRDKFTNRIRVLQMDDNNIRKLSTFLLALSDTGIQDGITAISAQQNSIGDLSFLGSLKSYTNLGELLLTGNPVTNDKQYREQIIRQLPRLQMLDQQLIQRSLLTLPNPIRATPPDEQKMNALLFLEQHLFGNTQAGNYDALNNVYNEDACYSICRNAEPFPSRINTDSLHNTADMPKAALRNMQTDFSHLRSNIRWRLFSQDSSTMRNISRGRPYCVKDASALCGASKPLRMINTFDTNVNVSFLEAGMKVPVCVVTIHGKAQYRWNPISPDSRAPTYQDGKEPFISVFFDRTFAMTWNTMSNSWGVANDMVFLRPDRLVVHDDGTPTEPLFFPGSARHVELLRRRLMPEADATIMRQLVERALSDQQVMEMVTRLRSLPPQQLQEAATSPDSLLRAIGL